VPDPSLPPELRITKVERDPEHGHWTARAVVNGEALRVDCCWGSWRAVLPGDEYREVVPALAAQLQRKVRPLERREARNGGRGEADARA
jgi:hypothetical protein